MITSLVDATNGTIHISGGEFTQNINSTSGKSAIEILLSQSAPGAFHNSGERYDAPKCHPETRVAVLDNIMQQVTTATRSSVIWLYGAAGAGKSSTVQTISERCYEAGLLIGSFFFIRSSALRNNTTRLAASLAYQLAKSIPQVLPHIDAYIKSDPAIFSSTLRDQMQHLFVTPLRRVCDENPNFSPSSKLLIIDGLDQCADPDVQRKALIVLTEIFEIMPLPAVALIASRPETHISSFFDTSITFSILPLSRINLSDDADAEKDIRIFLASKFDTMKRTHPFRAHIPSQWPLKKDLEVILQKSSSQFIFAATVVRYVESMKHSPHERLCAVFKSMEQPILTSTKPPFKEIDALYSFIFSCVDDEDQPLLLAILYLLLKQKDVTYPQTISNHLLISVGHVDVLVSQIPSLMKYEGPLEPIRVYHASLRDFLLHPLRSDRFYLESGTVHTVLAKKYLRKAFNEGELHPAALQEGVIHLREAIIDDELLDILSACNVHCSAAIKNFQRQQPTSPFDDWHDLQKPFKALPICQVISFVRTLDEEIALLRPGTQLCPQFWRNCVEAFCNLIYRELEPHLAQQEYRILLTIAIYIDRTIPIPPFSNSFHLTFGLSNGHHHHDLFSNDETTKRFVYIWRNSLTNPKLGSMAIDVDTVSLAALRCLKVIEFGNVNFERLTPYLKLQNEGLGHILDIKLCISGLIGLLPHAFASPELVTAIRNFKISPTINLELDRICVVKLNHVMSLYLRDVQIKSSGDNYRRPPSPIFRTHPASMPRFPTDTTSVERGHDRRASTTKNWHSSSSSTAFREISSSATSASRVVADSKADSDDRRSASKRKTPEQMVPLTSRYRPPRNFKRSRW